MTTTVTFSEFRDNLAKYIGLMVNRNAKISIVDGHEFCTTPDFETLTYFLNGPNSQQIVQVITPIIFLLLKNTKPEIKTSSDSIMNYPALRFAAGGVS